VSKGVNAFFVGSDFIAGKFKGLFDASNFYYIPAYSTAGKIGLQMTLENTLALKITLSLDLDKLMLI
jgi:hypothetical protein